MQRILNERSERNCKRSAQLSVILSERSEPNCKRSAQFSVISVISV